MKFLIVAPRFHTNLYYRVISLQNAGHEVEVVVLYKGKSEFYKGINIKQIKLSFLSSILISCLKLINKSSLKSNLEIRIQAPNKDLRKYINNFKPDYILLKAFQNQLAIKTLLLSFFKKSKVLMLIQTDKTKILKSKHLFKLNILLFKLLKVRAYVTPVEIAETLFKQAEISNCYYLPFVFPQNHTPTDDIISNKVKIISVGKFVNRKSQILLIQSLGLLKDSLNFELLLIGEKADNEYYKKVISEVEKQGLQNRVIIKLNVEYSKIQDLYKEMDIFVLPSYGEPAAYSPVEALSLGLPVVISSESGTNCYVTNGVNGYIFEKKNHKDLSEKISEITSSSKNLLNFKKNALLSAQQNHNLENFSKGIEEIIANLRL